MPCSAARSRPWPANGVPRDRDRRHDRHRSEDTQKATTGRNLDHGHTKANIKVAENLFRKGKRPAKAREAVTAAIFWLKGTKAPLEGG